VSLNVCSVNYETPYIKTLPILSQSSSGAMFFFISCGSGDLISMVTWCFYKSGISGAVVYLMFMVFWYF